MDGKALFGLLALALGLVAQISYLVGMSHGKTRPNPISWLAWSVMMTVMTIVIFSEGAGPAAWPGAIQAVFQVTVCILAFRWGGRRDIKRSDLICLAAAAVAFGFWAVADQAEIAVILISSAGFFGWLPTIRKAWRKPFEEATVMWSIDIVKLSVCTAAIEYYSFATVFNQALWIGLNLITVSVVLVRRRVMRKVKSYVS